MKTYKGKHFIYGIECTDYVLETLSDWDEYEKLLKENPNFSKVNPNFYSFKEDFEKYHGRIWKDSRTDERYRVIGIEDSNTADDWYWIVENLDDPRDTMYILANSWDLVEGLI